MKKVFSILSFALLVVSCQKTEQTQTISKPKSDTAETVQKFVIDSVRVADSVVINKNLTSSFNGQLLVFPTIKNKVVLDSIYKDAMVKSNTYDAASLKAALTKQMQEKFEKTKSDSKEWSPDFKQTWDESSRMKLISNRDNVMTLLYSGDGFSGGAHGYYFESYKVFDLNKNTVLNQSDIFKDPKSPSWDTLLKSHFDEPEQKEMLLDDKIALNNNFYFDNQKITFVYNQYEITAYGAGVVYITFKFSEIKDLLKPEFVSQYKIK